MEILKTSRLILRTWTMDDLQAAYTIWGDAEVMKFIDAGVPQNLEQVRKSIEAGIRHHEKYGFQHWAVIEKESTKLIGACGFNRAELEGEIELVFHFCKSSWGRGYATESSLACIKVATDLFKPRKIIAGCHPENGASIRVLLKSGFSYVGKKWFDDTQREEPYYEIQLQKAD